MVTVNHVPFGFSPEFAEKLLDHPNPHSRRWTVRFLGDDQTLTPALTKHLAALAASETDVNVRSQLASSARRFRAEDCLPIIEKLLQHSEDAKDPHLPLLLWWAIEQYARSSPLKIIDHFRASEAWQSAYTREVVFRNLMRRCAAAGKDVDMLACTEILAYGRAQSHRPMLLASFDQGLRDRPGPAAMQVMGSLFTKYAPAKGTNDVPKEIKFGTALTKQLLTGWKEDTTDATLLRLLVLADHQPARDRVRTLAFDEKVPLNLRVRMIALLAPVDLGLLGKAEGEDIRLATLDALANFDPKETPAALPKHYPDMPPKLRVPDHRCAAGPQELGIGAVPIGGCRESIEQGNRSRGASHHFGS